MSGKFKIPHRFALLKAFAAFYLTVSFVFRIVFFIWMRSEVSWHIIDFVRTVAIGFFFDLGTASYLLLPAAIYYFIVPDKFSGSRFDRIFIWLFTGLGVFILAFSFFAEITFWDEFKSRFNFIAVDYLIYTHEVVANIEQSYPLPLLISGVALFTFLILFGWYKKGVFAKALTGKSPIDQRGIVFVIILFTAVFFTFFIKNSQAEWSANRYNSEISKSGIYSFFAAFRNNQMKYPEFYTTIERSNAIKIVRNELKESHSLFRNDAIHRDIIDTLASAKNRNVVLIMVESLSGNFMQEFGNRKNITPFLDSLAQKSIFFENLYATGTRTVRGMEAVTLSIPPTPGQSIVKRPENNNLYTISNVFRNRGYTCNFFYGGDGYFDNMNSFFGGNGFNIYDRGRGSILSDAIKTKRYNINDGEVTFENAWGICDEDIFNKMVSVADSQYKTSKPFFNFIMTTSNHRPYTYPSNKVVIPSGMSREGAVQYTDFAIAELFRKSKNKPWFKNTIFIIVADHCASSAGKDEIDVANYHIPAFIANFPQSENQKITKQCSQIDIFPTLFSLFHWSYESDFFGRDVLSADFKERAFLGTYRKLVLMKRNRTMILSDGKKQNFYNWDAASNSLIPIRMDRHFLEETIAPYQTADYLFTNKLLK